MKTPITLTKDARFEPPKEPKDHNDEELVKAGKCASYIIASRPLFDRCVPQHIQNLTNSIIQTPGRNESNATVYDSNGQSLSGSRLEQSVKYLVDLLNLKQIGAMLVEDSTTSWKYILIAFAIAAIVSFVWIVLMHCGLSFFEFIQVREKNDNQILTEFKFVADANYYRSLPITWLIIAILSTLLLLISAFILLVLFKRLRIALATLQEASKAIAYNFFSLFWQFIPFLLHIAVFAYWAFVTVYLATTEKPIYRTALDETAANSTNVTYGEICDPNKWNNIDGMNIECMFWEYGYDRQIDLDSILNGTGQHFKSFIRFVNKNQWIPQLFSTFMFFWLTAFIIGFSEIVLARRAFHIIISNPLCLLVIGKVCDFLMFIGKLCITAGIGILAFFFFTHRIPQAKEYVPLLLILLVLMLLKHVFFRFIQWPLIHY
ncbi:unnamed protein product [Rotaria sordida]|uniref:Choline transporter-like protein n=1 Tax=Rotaria sordida TaxID=392033 RepID=A0A814XBF9_9BILA|nr:unnamed protein product [Rotaria sordida]